MTQRSLGVVGCGTAGPALALFAARAGFDVTLYERVVDPGPVGAGIVVQPTGQAVLARLGLLDHVMARGARIDRLLAESGRRRVVDLDYGLLGSGVFGLGLHRGALFEALFDAVAREPRIQLACGVDVVAAPAGPDGRRVVVDATGARHGHHDMVVVADGAASVLRGADALEKRVDVYPWGALWFVAEVDAWSHEATLYQALRGTQRMFGMLPTGLGPLSKGTNANRQLISVFWSIAERAVADWQQRPLSEWKAEAMTLAPVAEPLLDQINDHSDLLFSRYYDVRMPRHHADGVIFIGDAAHAMSPQLGQGCNLALFDAMVLADYFRAMPDQLDRAAAAYHRDRRHHLRYYQWATRMLTPYFQSDSRVRGWLRDRFMGLLCRLPWVRGQMIRSMAGIKRGILRRSLSLNELHDPGV